MVNISAFVQDLEDQSNDKYGSFKVYNTPQVKNLENNTALEQEKLIKKL